MPFLRETLFCRNIFLKEQDVPIFKSCKYNHIAKKTYFWLKETYFVTIIKIFLSRAKICCENAHSHRSTFLFLLLLTSYTVSKTFIMMYQNHFRFFYQILIAVLLYKSDQSKLYLLNRMSLSKHFEVCIFVLDHFFSLETNKVRHHCFTQGAINN